jgi:predicted N-acetyltransferase YhbS
MATNARSSTGIRTIRPAAQDDHAALVDVIRGAFVPMVEQFGITPDNCPVHPSLYDEARLAADIARGRRFHVLETAGEVVGCVALRPVDGGGCELCRLAVRPDRQGQGLGGALVDFAIRQAREEHAAFIELGLFADHVQLRQWYERMGFQHVRTCRIDVVPLPVAMMVMRLRGER